MTEHDIGTEVNTEDSSAPSPGLHDTNLLAPVLDSSLAHLLSLDLYPQAHSLPIASHDNLFPYAHPQLTPPFPWNHHQDEYNFLSAPFPGTSQSAPPPHPSSPRGQRTSSVRPRAASIPQSSPTISTHSSMETDDPNDEERVVDEKRRRNTAASARFRIKRKQKTINLERSVSDLSGRAEELEKEVADLRRENGWLKEIVMLKGSRFAAIASPQQRQALSQAVKDAGIDLGVDTNTTGTSISTSAQRVGEDSSDQESESG